MDDHSAGKPNGMTTGHPQGEGQEAPNHMNMDSMDMKNMNMGGSK